MKKSLGKKTLYGLVLFTLVLAVCICLSAAYYVRQRTIRKYEYVGTAITRTIADRLDGDRVMKYLETKQPDAYYEEVLNEIDVVNDRFDSLYTYIALPEEDHVLYIWSNGFSGEATIGFTTPFSEGGEAWMKGKMAGIQEEPLRFVSDAEFGEIATAASPIRNSRGETVALVLIDFSVAEINGAVLQVIVPIVLALLLLMVIFTLINVHFMQRELVRPIRKLTGAAAEMTANLGTDAAYVSDIHTGDEVETLSLAFEKMDRELREYISDNLRITAEKERIGAELDMAAGIQKDQLPSVFPPFPNRKDFDIYASMTPAKTVGGDFYDFFMVDEDHIALVMADVSGKGVPASLFMMISKILIKNRLQAGESPAEALGNVNRQLAENNKTSQFVTVWLAVVEISTGRGVAANAGHEHPALRRSGGEFALVEYRHSLPVATMEMIKFREHSFELHPGDSLFVYTDGVTEATRGDKTLFGTDRMLQALNRDPDAAPVEAVRNVMDGITAFVAGEEQFDDITMLCFRYFGPAPEKKEDPQ